MPSGSSLTSSTPIRSSVFLDLLGEVQCQAGFHGDVVGQFGVVQFAVPQAQGLGRGRQQRLGVGVAPGAAGVAVDEPSQACCAQPLEGVRVGVAGGQQPQRGLVGQVDAERGQPAGPQEFEQGVQPGQGLWCAA